MPNVCKVLRFFRGKTEVAIKDCPVKFAYFRSWSWSWFTMSLSCSLSCSLSYSFSFYYSLSYLCYEVAFIVWRKKGRGRCAREFWNCGKIRRASGNPGVVIMYVLFHRLAYKDRRKDAQKSLNWRFDKPGELQEFIISSEVPLSLPLSFCYHVFIIVLQSFLRLAEKGPNRSQYD